MTTTIARPAFAAGHPLEGMSELGDAELVGNYEDGSPEWHAARGPGIGGSDIACVLGIGFTSKYMLWMQKTGVVDPVIDPETLEMFEWGHLLEPVIAAKFQKNHPELEVITSAGSWRSKKYSFQLANPDGLLVDKNTGEMTVLEIKTSMNGAGWGPKGSGEAGVPRKYLAQVRWYLNTFGLRKAKIVVLIGLGQYREYEVYADDSWAGYALGEGFDFMESIRLGVCPPIDGGKDTYQFLREQNPSIDGKRKVEIPAEIAEMVASARLMEKEAEAEVLRARGHLAAHMGTAKTAMFEDKQIAVRMAKGDGVPYVQFK